MELAPKLIVLKISAGFYRVLYDDKLLSNIKNVLESDFTKIGNLSRSQLLDDYFNMAKHRECFVAIFILKI